MTRGPDFSEDEQEYIISHIGPGPGHLSWGQIARDLNRLYYSHNGGTRSRNSIWRWTRDFITKYPKLVIELKKQLDKENLQ